MRITRAGAAIGALLWSVFYLALRREVCQVQSYLRRNTHLQVGLELIASPAIGPTSSDTAYTELRYAEYCASFSGGTRLVLIAVAGRSNRSRLCLGMRGISSW
jgi:hypothetical protein